MKINNINIYLFISILSSVSVIYLFDSSFFSYFPVVFFALILIFFGNKKFRFQSWLVLVCSFFLSLYTFIIFLFNPYQGTIFSGYSISLFMFFISTFSCVYFFEKHEDDTKNAIFNCLLFFLIFQFIICIAQITYYYFGFGLPVKVESYSESSMLTGAFTNSNDLSAVLVIIAYIVSNITTDKFKSTLTWFLIILMIVFLGSRSSLLLLLVILVLSSNKKIITKIFYLLFFLILTYVILFFLSYSGTDKVFERSLDRLLSISSIIQDGVESDGSMKLRYESYKHFFYNFFDIGMGSGEVRNYYIFGKDANFDTSLILSNPHSLIVEIAYWSGYIGLILLFVLLFLLFYFFNLSLFYLFILVVSSMISSGALWSPIFIYLMIMGFFVSKNRN